MVGTEKEKEAKNEARDGREMDIPYRNVKKVTLHDDGDVKLTGYWIEGYAENFDIGNIIKKSKEVDIIDFHSKTGKSVTVCTDILK